MAATWRQQGALGAWEGGVANGKLVAVGGRGGKLVAVGQPRHMNKLCRKSRHVFACKADSVEQKGLGGDPLACRRFVVQTVQFFDRLCLPPRVAENRAFTVCR